MNFSAVLLAGGESRRMGRDKATVEWRGRPLWECQLEKLRALRPEKLFLSARSDVPWRPTDVELIPDAPPSHGPLSGLAAAIDTIETDFLLVLAIDMPFMTTEHLRHLSNLAANGMGIVSMIDGVAEPLAAIYPKNAGPFFHRRLQGDDFSMQPIVNELIDLKMLRAITPEEFIGVLTLRAILTVEPSRRSRSLQRGSLPSLPGRPLLPPAIPVA
jgi:molybdopterin-guanine dinucleotide biosynthesis protein A